MRLPLVIITLLTLFLTPIIQVASVEEEYDQEFEENRDYLPINEDELPKNDENKESEYPEVSPAPNADFDEDGLNDKEKEDVLPEETSEDVGVKEETELKPEFAGDGIKESSNSGVNDCGPPPTIERAKISSKRLSKYSVGDKVSYVCQFGYVTDGPLRFSHCVISEETQTPQWTKAEINCVPRSCGDPGSVNNGYSVGSIFTFPNFVLFECDEGYGLRGRGIRYCQTSGSWSGTLPTCERIFCDPPSDPENGRVSFSSLEYGSVLKYDCVAGFLLEEYFPRVCSENGTWSGIDPVCKEAKCGYPEAPEHGSVQLTGGQPSAGSLAVYTCEKGRILVGSKTSRCLDEGIWTFPTPKCANPCAVPKLVHGEIGKYVKVYRYEKRLEKIPVGTAIRDGEELYLTCHEKYEPLGTTNYEEKITCSGGQFSEEPRCSPASCRSRPPFTANVKDMRIKKEHGGNVVYLCNGHSKKVATGNVTCHFGNWRGKTPICKDTRCNFDSLQFTGMIRERKRMYKSNEGFHPKCDDKHSISDQNNMIICQDGEWKGHFPPCIPASCIEEPPSIEHGKIKNPPSMVHSTIVSYECDEFFQMEQGRVQCHFGEWTGPLPECRDSRCYSKDLKTIEGVAYGIKNVTFDGEYLEVKCVQGFSLGRSKPLCQNGDWIESKSPCTEDGCSINAISNGKFTKLVEKKNIWRTRWIEYHKVAINERKHPDSTQYVSCNEGYTFQGKGSNNVLVRCTQGKWKPSPVCLVNGQLYEEENIVTTRPSEDEVEDPLKVMAREKTKHPSSYPVPDASISESAEPEVLLEPDQPLINVTSENSCTCRYLKQDDQLIAYAGEELLRYGTRIKNNCKVRFLCKEFGTYVLIGSEEMICKDCRDWHSSEFPDCVVPEQGDVILYIQGNAKLLPGGYIGITKGDTVRFFCNPNGMNIHPTWFYPLRPNLSFEYERPLSSMMKITSAETANSGRYVCKINGFRPKVLTIKVIESDKKCPKFEEGNVFNIYYENGQAVNSTVIFSCKSASSKIVGPSVLTCLSNGRWSEGQPQCKIQCPMLTEVEGLFIAYTLDRNVGSTANFHCFSPRVLSGVPFTTCQSNGEWSDPVSFCSLPSCSIDDFFTYVPENVIPDMSKVGNEIVPYNFTLHLICDNDLMLMGSNTAKCGKEGVWEVSKVECVPGCAPLTKSDTSTLIVDPEKEFYRFGDIITLSCPLEQELDSDIVRIMCLLNVWSEEKIPNCQDKAITFAPYDEPKKS